MVRWIESWVALQRRRVFWNLYREATSKAIDSLEDDLLMMVEPKTLYDKGWNDAMKSMIRTLKSYKRSVGG